MALQNYTRVAFLVDDTTPPTSVTLVKVYCSSSITGTNIKTDTIGGTPYYWRANGGGTDDPGGAVTITLTKTATAADLNGDYYIWYGFLEESYTYALNIDGSYPDATVGIMLWGIEGVRNVNDGVAHAAASADVHGLSGGANVVGHTSTQTLTNKTLTDNLMASLWQDSIGGSYQITFPAKSDTLVGKTTTDTMTNKTLTAPVIATLYQDAGKTKLITFPATNGITVAATADLLTSTALIAALSDGSTNSNSVLKNLSALMVGNTRFAAQLAANKDSSTNDGDPDGVVVAKTPGEICVDTTNHKIYVAEAIGSGDWLAVN